MGVAGSRSYAQKTPYKGTTYRSRLEATVAQTLDELQAMGRLASWAYEPRTFEFFPAVSATKTTPRLPAITYTPDFCVTLESGAEVWLEAKGYKARDFALRLALLHHMHPEIDLHVVQRPAHVAALFLTS